MSRISGESFQDSRDLSRIQRHCLCFTLQKGITYLIIVELIQLIIQLIGIVAVLALTIREDDLDLRNTEYFFFWALTSALLTVGLGIKSYYGLKFLRFSSKRYTRWVHDLNSRRNN